MGRLFKIGCLVLAVVVLCLAAIHPYEKKLRKGKDLAGGVSMVYALSIDPGENAQEVMTRTIDVLKRRVDPNGLLEISMVSQGRDRIEISMPLPSDRVKALRQTFEDELVKLGRSQMSEARLEAALRQTGPTRDGALAELSAGNAARAETLKQVAAAWDRAEAANAKYAGEKDPVKKDALVQEVADAQIAYGSARDGAIASALSASEIRKIVQAPTRERFIEDKGERVKLPSSRALVESQTRAAHPESAAEIDRVLGLHAAYMSERTTLDDPTDLTRVLRGAGVLTFRIAPRSGEHPEESRLREEVRKGGPRNVKSADARWFRINQLENWINTKAEADALAKDPNAVAAILGANGHVAEHYAGDYYMLLWDTRQTRLIPSDGAWSVSGARRGMDQRGRPAIDFTMNTVGGVLLGRLTREHVQKPMAILLDDEVYTAPNLNGEITTSGQIMGDFPAAEVDYIIRVLAGGSLQAKLGSEPISISSMGPELGADNLRRGLYVGGISLVVVAGFMIVYYFGFGVVAVIALLANALIILGCMAVSKAAFTMPGIAGVILSFGMAVDSNVLVYERMREEFNRGADMKTAVRLGFDRALSAIVDGNVTNLIVCVVLYYTGTPEIRGFAITMGIGVLSTLFATLVVSRWIFDSMVYWGWKRKSPGASMLPMAIPRLQSWLTPNVDWLKYRYAFFTVSAIIVSLGLGMVIFQGKKLLDNEFRGGTAVTLKFKQDPAWKADPTRPNEPAAHITMTRAEVEGLVSAIGKQAPEGDQLRELASAEIVAVNPRSDGVTSDQFVIKSVATNASAVLDSLKLAFQSKLDSKPALRFTGETIVSGRDAPVFPIDKPTLGDVLNKPGARQNMQAYQGGVAVLLENIAPPPTLDSLRERLDAIRLTENYSDTLTRRRDVFVLVGDENAVKSAVVVSADETASIFENEQRWEQEVRDREWALASEALTKDASPASVQSFSPAIASTFRANATTAAILSFVLIGIYIWVRFKTPRYSIAAVVALIHDVLTVIGLVALAAILYNSAGTTKLASALYLLPFKIDLNMVAALLTIAGYSLNDTVVIMDRIRENTGKLPAPTKEIINESINQTFSRTIITGGTTMLSCLALYLYGGEGMRPFAFALFTGLVVGTYSSIAVAAPIVWSRRAAGETAGNMGRSIVPA